MVQPGYDWASNYNVTKLNAATSARKVKQPQEDNVMDDEETSEEDLDGEVTFFPKARTV